MTNSKAIQEANKLFTKPQPACLAPADHAAEQQKVRDNMDRLRRERLEREGRRE
jgi:hypothetical protein